jgi:hypothetical protein
MNTLYFIIKAHVLCLESSVTEEMSAIFFHFVYKPSNFNITDLQIV